MPTLSRIRSAGTSSSVPETLRVGHPAGVLDQRLDAAERLPEREHLGPRAHVERVLLAAGHAEGDDPAVPLHLAAGDLVTGVLGQPRVEDLADGLVAR